MKHLVKEDFHFQVILLKPDFLRGFNCVAYYGSPLTVLCKSNASEMCAFCSLFLLESSSGISWRVKG